MFLSIFEFNFLYFLKSVRVYHSEVAQVSVADAPSSAGYYRVAIMFSIEGVWWGPGGSATGDTFLNLTPLSVLCRSSTVQTLQKSEQSERMEVECQLLGRLPPHQGQKPLQKPVHYLLGPGAFLSSMRALIS